MAYGQMAGAMPPDPMMQQQMPPAMGMGAPPAYAGLMPPSPFETTNPQFWQQMAGQFVQADHAELAAQQQQAMMYGLAVPAMAEDPYAGAAETGIPYMDLLEG